MTKEEKAKEYALKQLKYHIDRGDKELTYSTEACINIAAIDYVIGYTQAEQDLSSQLTACKEALTHLVNLCDASSAEEVVFYEMEHNIDLDTVLTKAKTLIE